MNYPQPEIVEKRIQGSFMVPEYVCVCFDYDYVFGRHKPFIPSSQWRHGFSMIKPSENDNWVKKLQHNLREYDNRLVEDRVLAARTAIILHGINSRPIDITSRMFALAHEYAHADYHAYNLYSKIYPKKTFSQKVFNKVKSWWNILNQKLFH